MPKPRSSSETHSPAARHLASSFPLEDFARAVGKPTAPARPTDEEPDAAAPQESGKVVTLETAGGLAVARTFPESVGQGSPNPYAEWKKQFILNAETAERLEDILGQTKRTLGYSVNRSELLRVFLLALDDSVLRRFLAELGGLGNVKRRPYKKDNQRDNQRLERTLAQALRRCMKP